MSNGRAWQRRLGGRKSPPKLPRQEEEEEEEGGGEEEEEEEEEEVPRQGHRLAPSFLPATLRRGRGWKRS